MCSTRSAPYAHGIAEYACGAPWAHGIGAIHSLRLFRALMVERCALNPPSGRSGYPPSEASRAAGAMRGASGAKGGCSATAFPPTPTRYRQSRGKRWKSVSFRIVDRGISSFPCSRRIPACSSPNTRYRGRIRKSFAGIWCTSGISPPDLFDLPLVRRLRRLQPPLGHIPFVWDRVLYPVGRLDRESQISGIWQGLSVHIGAPVDWCLPPQFLRDVPPPRDLPKATEQVSRARMPPAGEPPLTRSSGGRSVRIRR